MDSTEKRIIITGGSGFIGTNLVELYINQGWQVLNMDFRSPRNSQHQSVWCNVDILDSPALNNTILDFQPTYLLHFAARTDLDEKKDLKGYAANIEGVQNIVEAVKATSSIKRVIFASSQLVCKIGYQPKNDEDYCPDTLYGKSKVLTEQIVRSSSELRAAWVLVRPTSIWGPWFDVPYKNFFEAIYKGLYIHSAGIHTYKQWGFIGNTIFQVNGLLKSPEERVNKKTFYLADYEPLLLEDFANLVQKEMNVTKVKRISPALLKTAAILGDFLQYLGWKNPPLSTFRYNNIIASELQNLIPLQAIVGPLPYSIRDGVAITVAWMKMQGNIL